MKKTIRVVAAIIEKEDKIMIAKRSYGEFEGLWEFPGGKYEEGETGEQALKREIEEECDTEISIKDFLCTVKHRYTSFNLIMDCYICELVTNELHLHDHTAYRFIEPNERKIDWVPADKKVIKAYKQKLAM